MRIAFHLLIRFDFSFISLCIGFVPVLSVGVSFSLAIAALVALAAALVALAAARGALAAVLAAALVALAAVLAAT